MPTFAKMYPTGGFAGGPQSPYWSATGDASYVVGGGNALSPGAFGYSVIDGVQIVNKRTISVNQAVWNAATQKIQVYNGSTGAELAAAVNTSTEIWDIIVLGH